ncbi:MAG: SDR family NAD(P)-dependent oxidoreductase [Gammaproteobacteria bacterium]|nr:SDR family NAD(P)-dependent oxidoreductase [Gammaproteobacteria bacterium]
MGDNSCRLEEQALMQEQIAIVGMACRFPQAGDLEAYWELLRAGRDAIRNVPDGRWDRRMFADYEPIVTGNMSIERAGFLENIEQFDPYFFKISPREACRIDPQQRLLLEVAWEALEHGGHASPKLAGSSTGVFIGIMSNEYESFLGSSPDEFDVYDVPGNTYSIVANRISYQFDLCGPSLTVDTACSSSLVTTHLACQSLRGEECDMAIAGGVNALVSPFPSIKYYQMGMLSPDGLCKTFDASANGYVRGEGAGIIILKRLSDALRDNDHIFACIKGSAVNQNGRGVGLTAPNGLAQQKVIRMALQRAGIRANEVDYIEAHGTGTPLGDPIEVGALEEVLREGRKPGHRCYLGSAKTNIGHTESAAGVAGLIKTVLSLQHAQIPPHRNLSRLNPKLESALDTFEIPSELKPWPRTKRPRYAGINSFGFGGANAHIILEEAPERQIAEDACERPLHVLRLSAHTDVALRALARRFYDYLDTHPKFPLTNICYSANTGRPEYEKRTIAYAESTDQLQRKLQLIANGEDGENISGSTSNSGVDPKVVFLFPGGRADCVAELRQLYETHPASQEIIKQCSIYLQKQRQISLLEYLYSAESGNTYSAEAWVSEPILFVLEYALAKLWMSWGVKPAALLGWGVGEYVAACIADVFTLEDGLYLAVTRARLEASLPSGRNTDEVIDAYEAEIDSITFRSPVIPILSSVDGERGDEFVVGTARWLKRTLSPLHVDEDFRSLANDKYDVFVEIGKKSSVCSEAEQLVSRECLLVPGLQDGETVWDTLSSSIAMLYSSGVGMDWEGYDRGYCRYKVPLPTYPFERERCWYKEQDENMPDAALSSDSVSEEVPNRSLDAGEGSSTELDGGDILVREKLFTVDQPVMRDHVVLGKPVLPAAAYMDMVLAVFSEYTDTSVLCLESMIVATTFELNSSGTNLARVTVDTQCPNNGCYPFRVSSREIPVHAVGEIKTISNGVLPENLDLAGIRNRCEQNIAVEDIYARYADTGIDYRGSFRSISWLRRNEIEALACLELFDGTRREEEDIHRTVVVDGALQVLGAFYLDAGMSGTYLPFSIEKVTVFSRLPARVYCYFSVSGKSPQYKPGDELCQGNLVLTDDKGRVAVQLDGVSIKRVKNTGNTMNEIRPHLQEITSNSTAVSGKADDSPSLIHRADWRPLPIGAPAEHSGAKTWLVLVDEAGIGDALMKLLGERGDICIAVTIADKFSEVGGAYCIAQGTPGDYQLLVEDLSAKGITPTGIIHIWGTGGAEHRSGLAGLEENLGRGVYSLFYLTQSLTAQFRETLEFWVVTSHGQPVEGRGDKYVHPDQSALWGLAKVIPKEYARVRCAGVDLDASGRNPRELAETLCREISASPSDHDFESWVAYRGNERLVATLIPVAGIENRGLLPLRENGVYLVTGGQGGVGLEIARFIASNVKSRLVLLNRSPLDEVRHPDRVAGVRALESMGAEVMAVSADVSDFEAMSQLVEEIKRRWGPVNGVVHSAGILKDGLIPNMDYSHFSDVLRPKVQGTWVLDEVTHSCSPDFFVMCSSMVTYIAPMGQSTHVAACAFEDSFALYRTAVRGLKTLCINWGLWGDTGVVSSPRYKEALEAQGVYAMSNEEGIAGFAWALSSGLSRVVCGAVGIADGGESEAVEYGLPQQAFSDPDRIDNTEIKNMTPEAGRGLGQQIEEVPEKTKSGERAFIQNVLDQLCTAYIGKSLLNLGWKPQVGEQFSVQMLARDLNVVTPHHRLLGRFLQILAEDGILQKKGDMWEVFQIPAAANPSVQCIKLLDEYPQHRLELLLVAHCAEKLVETMRGELEALEVLFPGGSTKKLEELYECSPYFSSGNKLLVTTISSMLDKIPHDRPVKILEVGAGTAATTACLLPLLEGRRAEYVFTDLSNLFLRNAAQRFSAHSFVSYQLFDAEKDPGIQGLVERDFDIVVAAHALHATKDISNSLSNIYPLVKPGGAMLLVESIQRQRWKDIVFGMTDGWWHFTDIDVRPDYPILEMDTWRTVLEKVGFSDIEGVFSNEALAKEQGVIIARTPVHEVMFSEKPARISAKKPRRENLYEEIPEGAGKRLNGSLERWVQQQLITQIAQSLRVPDERIHKDRSFSDMGVDSLIGVEIIGALKKNLAIPLAPTLLFEYSTIEVLGAHLIDKYEKELRQRGESYPVSSHREEMSCKEPCAATVNSAQEKSLQIPVHLHNGGRAEKPDEDLTHWVSSTISSHIARSLRVPLERLKIDRNFSEMGIDSLVGVEIIGMLKKEFGIGLAPTLLFEHPTLDQLTLNIVQQIENQPDSPIRSRFNGGGGNASGVGVEHPQGEVVVINKVSSEQRTAEMSENTVDYTPDHQSWLIGKVKTQLANSLRVPEQRISSNRSFVELGVDSLVGVEIVGALKKELGIPLGPTILFEYPNVQDLAMYIYNNFTEQLGFDKETQPVTLQENKVDESVIDSPEPEVLFVPEGEMEFPPPEVLLQLYDQLSGYCQRTVDNAASYAEANSLIVQLSATHGN